MDLVGKALGKLQINGRLGSGGMGTVYRAFHPGLQVDVAVKVLSAEMASDPSALVRFRRECTVLARLNHPGLLPVHDSDTWEGIAYFVMPVVDHPTLEAEIESHDTRNEPYPIARALDVTHSLLGVLEVVHRANVIHRDIKPANIFVQPSGQVLLADFGLALSANDFRVTRTGAAMGTLLWMAPEQYDAQELDHLTDLYQVGLVLYRMLAGALPYQNGVSDAVKMKCLAESLPPIAARELPPALHTVVHKLTARNASARYQSASDAIRELAPIRAGAAASGDTTFRTAELTPAARRRTRRVAQAAPGEQVVVLASSPSRSEAPEALQPVLSGSSSAATTPDAAVNRRPHVPPPLLKPGPARAGRDPGRARRPSVVLGFAVLGLGLGIALRYLGAFRSEGEQRGTFTAAPLVGRPSTGPVVLTRQAPSPDNPVLSTSAPGPRGADAATIEVRMAALWPGYTAGDMESQVYRIIAAGEVDRPADEEVAKRLRVMMRLALPADEIRKLVQERFLHAGILSVQLPGGASASPQSGDLPPAPLDREGPHATPHSAASSRPWSSVSMLKVWVGGAHRVLDHMERFRLVQRRVDGLTVADLRVFACNLFLFQPRFHARHGGRTRQLLSAPRPEPGALLEALVLPAAEIDPRAVFEKATALDRLISAYVQERPAGDDR